MALDKLKEIALLFFVLIAFYSSLYVSEGETIRKSFWMAILIFAVLFGFLAVQSADDSQRMSSLGGGENVFGRNMGFFLLACLYFMEAGFMKLPLMGLMFFAVMLNVASGSRGAMISLIFAVIAYLWLKRKGIKPFLKLFSILIFSGILFYFFVGKTDIGQKTMSIIETRIIKLTIEEQYTSNRPFLYERALNLGYQAPWFGKGLNAFSNEGLGRYPHNIFLEVFDEGGLVGLILIFLVMYSFTSHVMRYQASLDGPTAAALVLSIVAAQFSGDLYDSRAIFIFMILCTVPSLVSRQTNEMVV